MNQIILTKKYHLPQRKIRRLTLGMRLFPPLYELTYVGVRLFFLVLPVLSLYDQASIPSIGQMFAQIFWNAITLLASGQSIGFLVLLFQEAFFIFTYFKYRYESLKSKLGRILTPKNGPCPGTGLLLKPIQMTHLQVQLKQLTLLSVNTMQYKRQIRYVPAVAYFGGSILLEIFLFLSLSRQSNPVMRLVALQTVLFLGTLFFSVHFFMGEFNCASKRLLPELNYVLHRVRAPTGKKLGSKLILGEKMEMIASDQIAVSMAGIFSLTRLALLKFCFTLVQNVFLILLLNDSNGT